MEHQDYPRRLVLWGISSWDPSRVPDPLQCKGVVKGCLWFFLEGRAHPFDPPYSWLGLTGLGNGTPSSTRYYRFLFRLCVSLLWLRLTGVPVGRVRWSVSNQCNRLLGGDHLKVTERHWTLNSIRLVISGTGRVCRKLCTNNSQMTHVPWPEPLILDRPGVVHTIYVTLPLHVSFVEWVSVPSLL